MRKIKLIFVCWFSLLIHQTCFSQVKEIAITIDDLPFVGSTNGKPANVQRQQDRFLQMVQALVAYKVPATGFIIAGAIEKHQWALLELFREKGFILGNHTYSHKSLNNMSAEKYIADVDKADKIIQPFFSGPKYFRYPYLAESTGEKRQKVHDYLAAHHYIIAPITIDSKDYQFNAQLFAIPYRLRPQNLGRIKKRYLDYIWTQTVRAEARAKRQNQENAKQILLIHANLLNSHFLGDILAMYEKNGYKFISLEEALKAPAPIINTPIQQDGPTKDTPIEENDRTMSTTSLLDSSFLQFVLTDENKAVNLKENLVAR
ncbi:polysaccharide deacetylase [Legionella beliardensis]|uniref:Polysaccharide deacetylase n=1 Tax=Legionella beliardensis TaxID=91822 RepID=A0A378HZH0_9GAMM|nr:polysaccharide deacetylase family protein [Legionella beliardensis]STX28329.1 polysaccharide deacetylase [Legionella beliardensis]